MVPVSRARPPRAAMASSRGAIQASTSAHDAGRPWRSGPLSRPSSYSESTEACPTAQVAPPETGEDGFPSILIGRPSRVLASRPHPAPQPPQVVAYQVSTPGSGAPSARVSGGTACRSGMGGQLASAAAPRLNPISFRKSLRLASPGSQPSPSPSAPSRSLSMSIPPSALVMAFTAIQSADGRVELAAVAHRGRDHPLAAVAVEAPAHDQRLFLTYPFHGLHRPVAPLAGHPATAHVLAVAEEDEVRQLVDAGPADGPPLRDGLLELLHLRRGHLEPAVAIHAD